MILHGFGPTRMFIMEAIYYLRLKNKTKIGRTNTRERTQDWALSWTSSDHASSAPSITNNRFLMLGQILDISCKTMNLEKEMATELSTRLENSMD